MTTKEKIQLSTEFSPELDYDIWYHVVQNGKIDTAKTVQKLLVKKYKQYPELHKRFMSLKNKTMAVKFLPEYDPMYVFNHTFDNTE